jgi:hypothetical protein
MILADGSFLEREISYDLGTGLLMVRDGAVVKVYNSTQVKSFSYVDTIRGVSRRYVSLPFAAGLRRARPVFFEQLAAGELRLVRIPRSVRAARAVTTETDDIWYDYVNTYDYYVYTNGRFVPMRRFREEVYDGLMADYHDELKAYARRLGLNLNTQRGRFMVINRYNLLKNPSSVVVNESLQAQSGSPFAR